MFGELEFFGQFPCHYSALAWIRYLEARTDRERSVASPSKAHHVAIDHELLLTVSLLRRDSLMEELSGFSSFRSKFFFCFHSLPELVKMLLHSFEIDIGPSANPITTSKQCT